MNLSWHYYTNTYNWKLYKPNITMKIKILTNNKIKTSFHSTVFIISGQSGGGKSTLIKELCSLYQLEKVIPYTTRDRRPDEVNGIDYHFISKEEFISSNAIICRKVNGNNYYGLPKNIGGNILDLDPEGILNFKREVSDRNVVVIALYQPLLTRIWRMLKRGDKISSIVMRIRHDKKAFQSLNEIADFICYPHIDTIQESAEIIWDNIISKMI